MAGRKKVQTLPDNVVAYTYKGRRMSGWDIEQCRTHQGDITEVRCACILPAAAKGDVNTARKVIGGAIRSVIGSERAKGSYMSDKDARGEGTVGARYYVYVSDFEFFKICVECEIRGREHGFERAPIDAYHD